MTETTTTRNFRENLKRFFDLAQKSPVSINRGAERFVLMNENEFLKMKEEVMNLQKSLISALQHLDGDTTPAINLDASENDDPLFQEYAAKFKKRSDRKLAKRGDRVDSIE